MKNNWTQTILDSSFCNYTNLPHLNELTETKEFKSIFVSILGIITIVSVTGTVFTCFVIVRRHLLKNTVWIYLFILSIADGSMTLSSAPIAILGTFDERFLCIQWLCELNVSSQSMFGTISICTVSAISIYKMNHISKPLASLGDSGICAFICYIVLTSINAFGLTLPPLFGFSKYVHFPGRKWCSIWSKEKVIQSKIMLTVILALGFVIPFIIIFSTSIRTYNVFCKHNTKMKKIRRTKSHKIIARNRSILKTLFLVVAFFIATWTPFAFYTLFKAAGVKMPLIISHLAYMVMVSQGCINPIIYCFKHRAFNQFIKKLVRGKKASLQRLNMTRQINSQEFSSIDEDASLSRNRYRVEGSSRNKDQDINFSSIKDSRKDHIGEVISTSVSK